MEIGFSAGSLSESERGIQALVEGNIHAIEVVEPFLLNREEKEIAEIQRELGGKNISVYSVHATFGPEEDLSHLDEQKRKSMVSTCIKIMEKMPVLGTSCFVIHPGWAGGEKVPEKEMVLRRSLEELLQKAESLKVKIAVENMLPHNPGTRTQTLKKIMDEFSSPFLGICFDTGHANLGEGAIEQFIHIKDHLFSFHLNDNDGAWYPSKPKDPHLQPPYGSIDWERFFQLVASTGYSDPMIIEALPWQGREIGWMKKEVEMLRDGKIIKGTSPSEHFLRCAKCGHFMYGTESDPICYCTFENKR